MRGVEDAHTHVGQVEHAIGVTVCVSIVGHAVAVRIDRRTEKVGVAGLVRIQQAVVVGVQLKRVRLPVLVGVARIERVAKLDVITNRVAIRVLSSRV